MCNRVGGAGGEEAVGGLWICRERFAMQLFQLLLDHLQADCLPSPLASKGFDLHLEHRATF